MISKYTKMYNELISNCKKDIQDILFNYFNECYIYNKDDKEYLTLKHIIGHPRVDMIKYDKDLDDIVYHYGLGDDWYVLPHESIIDAYNLLLSIKND